jgi:hypothetical protein
MKQTGGEKLAGLLSLTVTVAAASKIVFSKEQIALN